jgi:predicted enzyme related to lactoylglutathione lyase
LWFCGALFLIGTSAAAAAAQMLKGHEPYRYTIFYVQVNYVQAYLDKMASLGGKMLVPPIAIPTGTFRVVRGSRAQYHRPL